MFKIALFVPFFITVLYAFYTIKKGRIASKRYSVNRQVGQKFPLLPLIDSSGNKVAIDKLKSGITIIDFWYKNCPQCIAEMRQFEGIVKEREANVSIISISIDSYNEWKSLLLGKEKRFSFIGRPVINWQHLLLQGNNDAAARENNSQQLFEKLGVSGFPSFFVLDKNGIIVAVPTSAVEYIKTNVAGENGFFIFLQSADTWASFYMLLLLFFSVVGYRFIFIAIEKQLTRQKQ